MSSSWIEAPGGHRQPGFAAEGIGSRLRPAMRAEDVSGTSDWAPSGHRPPVHLELSHRLHNHNSCLGRQVLLGEAAFACMDQFSSWPLRVKSGETTPR